MISRKLALVFALVIVLVTQAVGWQDQSKAQDCCLKISVCIFNDRRAPVDEKQIEDNFKVAAKAYHLTGIDFKVVARAYYDDYIYTDPLSVYKSLSQISRYGQIKILFSNQPELALKIDDQHLEMIPLLYNGLADDSLGLAIILRCNKRLLEKNLAGQPALATTIMHELGHCLGLGHSDNPRSFMYETSGSSYGEFTATELIKLKLYRLANK